MGLRDRWEDILVEPNPMVDRTSVALWHHARAIAYANLGEFDAARQEADAFEDAAQRIPEDAALTAPRDDLLAPDVVIIRASCFCGAD
jgi:hypothetical protein